ncbi:MAG: PKD domain-containing protein [Flavobacteriales bacterium]
MSSKHPFDDQLRQAFQGFEPEVNAPWDALERELDGVKSAPESSTVNAANRWAVAAAVAAGGALMWLGKPAVDELIVAATEVPSEMPAIQAEPIPWTDATDAASFESAWDQFTQETPAFSEDVLTTDLEGGDESSSKTSADLPTEPLQRALENASPAAVAEVVEDDMPSLDVLLASLPFTASSSEACEGVEVSFELSGLDKSLSFLWNFGDGSFSNDPAPRHTFMTPGTYDITLSVRAPSDGVIRTRTIQNMITVLPKPQADFSWAFPEMVHSGKVRVQLQDQTPDATATQWVFEGESDNSHWIQLEVPGAYPVNLVASNKYGCLDDARHDIVVGDRHGLGALARFSPDGDGRYDSFLPPVLRETSDLWEMVISDAKGKEVYRTRSVDQPWDGMLPDGTAAGNRSKFHWTVRCQAEDGTGKLFTDEVRVER